MCISIYTHTKEWKETHKKEWNLAICDNMNGPRGYYAKWNKSHRERHILYDFTYMLNLKNKRNEQTKQNRNKLMDTENKLAVARREKDERKNEIGKDNKKYKISAIK